MAFYGVPWGLPGGPSPYNFALKRPITVSRPEEMAFFLPLNLRFDVIPSVPFFFFSLGDFFFLRLYFRTPPAYGGSTPPFLCPDFTISTHFSANPFFFSAEQVFYLPPPNAVFCDSPYIYPILFSLRMSPPPHLMSTRARLRAFLHVARFCWCSCFDWLLVFSGPSVTTHVFFPLDSYFSSPPLMPPSTADPPTSSW